MMPSRLAVAATAAIVGGSVITGALVAHATTLDLDGGIIQVFTEDDVDPYVGDDEPAPRPAPAAPDPNAVIEPPSSDSPTSSPPPPDPPPAEEPGPDSPDPEPPVDPTPPPADETAPEETP